LSPFRHRTYAVIWTATVVANIGGWMYSAAAAWLMTSLDADPLMVSLVQVATSLPMFCSRCRPGRPSADSPDEPMRERNALVACCTGRSECFHWVS
jgi:hypothetical protein